MPDSSPFLWTLKIAYVLIPVIDCDSSTSKISANSLPIRRNKGSRFTEKFIRVKFLES
jgi:hypothetical protein